MRFIDLFAGLGGFHVGLAQLGHRCVFASEKQSDLARLYEQNFKIKCHGDITKISEKDIPSHDILCAGFPCQPFSKAGGQAGLKDKRGNLFLDIIRILNFHKPKYFILENVANIIRHDKGRTWQIIKNMLEIDLKYELQEAILSPHHFGIPQIRERVFLVGCKNKELIKSFSFPKQEYYNDIHISSILDSVVDQSDVLGKKEQECIGVWQEFLDQFPETVELPSFPIWAMEFGATYPFEGKAPYEFTKKELLEYRGAFGVSLNLSHKQQQIATLPKYAQKGGKEFPTWKKTFIRQNREFYETYKVYIDPVLPKIQSLSLNSWQKFEWNCKGEPRDLRRFILQFRSSGLRVKRSNYSPSLVASTLTQLPIIGWENRYMSKTEAAQLQSLHNINLPERKTTCFKALGNAVNATIISRIAENLFEKENVRLINDNILIQEPV